MPNLLSSHCHDIGPDASTRRDVGGFAPALAVESDLQRNGPHLTGRGASTLRKAASEASRSGRIWVPFSPRPRWPAEMSLISLAR